MSTLTLTIGGDDTRALREPYPNALYVIADGACPSCGADKPFAVRGNGKTVDPASPHDTWRADGFCCACKKQVGVIRAKVETIFGIEEDERVLLGRWRVY